jgi:CxxC-x17-CxxC domain-containing protein
VKCRACFSGQRDSGFRPQRRDDNVRTWHDAPQQATFTVKCAECGDMTEVPFRPTGERPVLCKPCLKGGPRRGPAGRGGDSSGDLAAIRAELARINEKLDAITEALFEPEDEDEDEDVTEEAEPKTQE